MVDDIFTIDRSSTLFYYFQGNRDGSGKVKQEFRYGRNLWNKNAQIKIRIPVITKFPALGAPYSGLGNLELGYSYGVTSPKFDHTLEFRGAFNTNANNVDNHDNEIKGFYYLKWKWKGGALSYKNEYDQSFIVAPNGSWTSYYEGELQVPDVVLQAANPSLKLSVLYYVRALFDSGGTVKDAIGLTLFGGADDTSFLVTDTWGIGANGLWKYKLEANFTARF